MSILNNVEKLSDAIAVSCFKKGFIKNEYGAYISFEFKITNTSKKAIRTIKGKITFNTITNEKIQTLNLIYGHLIKSGTKKIYKAAIDYDPLIPEDCLLKEESIKALKVEWFPEKLIFEDGSVLE